MDCHTFLDYICSQFVDPPDSCNSPAIDLSMVLLVKAKVGKKAPPHQGILEIEMAGKYLGTSGVGRDPDMGNQNSPLLSSLWW